MDKWQGEGVETGEGGSDGKNEGLEKLSREKGKEQAFACPLSNRTLFNTPHSQP